MTRAHDDGPAAPLPDRSARELVATAFDESLLVEAGAGSGKTTALVARMVGLVRDARVEVERIAAVTFTRKAAGELRERFQGALEEARAAVPSGSEDHERLDRALRSVDRAFMGTIHAFCARLLRERPLEAGLDPAFRELTAPEAKALALRWWTVWLERLAADGDPLLARLDEIGIRPDQLQHTFMELGEHSDVTFPEPEVARPHASEVRALRGELEALMAAAEGPFPAEEPEPTWDGLQDALRTAWFVRRTLDWTDERVMLETAALVHQRAGSIVLKRWEKGAGIEPKELKERFAAWAEDDSRATSVIRRWRAHRYPVALGFARRAATEFAAHRRRTGQLTFHDLLVLTAALLRASPAARRDLGGRYRHVLVDEFQDTDPLQAEVLFLLASEPGTDDWRAAEPRPGALFVVGDPKQSIYRFRRADIALYQQVRDRFDDSRGGFGRVLRLTANFRSRSPVAELVNAVFDDPRHFPQEPDERQAAFAPLEPQRPEGDGGAGVYVYDIPPCEDPDVKHWGKAPIERATEARALAAWIARRVASGERAAGDFLVLARGKRGLDVYARALEALDLPVAVSGAGVGIEMEIAELEHVLEALTDPDDPVRTVTALTGLFFGLDLGVLLRHRERWAAERGYGAGAFDFRTVTPVAESDYEDVHAGDPAAAALGTLHRWWKRARHQPADIVVAEIVDELGLLPWAAAGELGQVRAGALAFALEAVRGSGLDGDTSLAGALEALRTALADDETEAPLEPERPQAIRLMNLHKAKGLEGTVVVLVNPYGFTERPRRLVIERSPDGSVAGWVRVGEPSRWGAFEELAQPLAWEDKDDAEQRFADAEETRLLYVAATRACDELVVTRCGEAKRAGKSPWSAFHAWLDRHAIPLALDAPPPGPRRQLVATPESLARRVDFVVARRQAAAEAGYAFDTVTRLVRAEAPGAQSSRDDDGAAGERASDGAESSTSAEPSPLDERLGYDLSDADGAGPGGLEWGSAVHATLEAAMRGLDGPALRAAARTALLENDRPVRNGEPTELDTLLALVERVRASDIWARATRAEIVLAEHPFVLEREDGRFLEGVIDLAFRDEAGWTIVDYKTDRRGAAAAAERLERYHAQLRLYGEALEALTGEPVAAASLLFLSPGADEA